MLVTNGFADSSVLSGPISRVKVKLSSVDSGSSLRTMVGDDRRAKLGALEDSCIVGTSPTVTSTTSVGTNISTAMSHRREDNAMLSTVRSTTPQVQRVLERRQTRWPAAASANGAVGGPRRNDETVTCPVSAFSIVASKGELARNSSRCEAPASSGGVVVKRRTATRTATNGDVGVVLLRDATKKQHKDPRRFSKSIGIPKSASVPANLQAGLRPSQKTLSRVHHEDGILKRSSAFLASLATSKRIGEKKHIEGSNGGIESLRATGYHLRESSVGPRHPSLRSYLSILTGGQDDLFALKRVSSVQTLPISGLKKKNVTGVRKSVSFSSDTSFEEKRSPLRKSAVHEVKVYRKGVLQDSHQRGSSTASKVPPSLESPSEGPTALLRAAREADDARLKEMLVTRPRKLGQKGMDVNLTDSSGRTAISYMAGNGTAAMLELALSLEGADPNLPDNEGNTPLHFAAQAGQTECLNILLQRCPDIEVDARNSLGFTPLMKAALQGRTKCAKILLFAGANPTLRDHGRGLRAEQWARFCGRYVCAEVIERFARHRLLERTTSCRWGSEPELAAKVLQGKVTPVPVAPLPAPSSGFKSKIRKVFRTTSGPDRSFSLVSQLTTAALCASSPALPKPGDVPPVVKSLLRPLSVPQLRVTLVSPQDFLEKTSMDKYACSFTEKIENTIAKPPRTKKKSK